MQNCLLSVQITGEYLACNSSCATGNFQWQGSNPQKRAHCHFLNKIQPWNTVLQIHMWRKYCGRFTDIVALKVDDIAISCYGIEWKKETED